MSTLEDRKRRKARETATVTYSESPWQDISLDFITHLPVSRGPEQYDSILVVVDRLTKMAHFIPTWMKGTAITVALQFFDHIVKHHGLPSSIVSDRIQNLQVLFGARLRHQWDKAFIVDRFSSSNGWPNREDHSYP